ncbi:DNA helicase IV [Thaumasiovibrio subtropicus]|uniref:DNA helicase IV n=1 Tax=Thaumasiovibrio subtropicus TaxID=1891207 RepID=UPI000B35D115|nr:DNA helicase IV [Thaumasiovibrio subtropicus]
MGTEHVTDEVAPVVVASLCATPIAQWFAQGDFCYIALCEADTLWLQGIGHEQEVSFQDWNGEVTLYPGLLWSTLALTSAESDKTWWVHGLPSRAAKTFVAKLNQHYVAWAKDKVAAFDAAMPNVKQIIADYYRYPQYMRLSDFRTMRSNVLEKLSECQLPESLVKSFRPQNMAHVEDWLDEDIDLRNDLWQNDELERWETWLDGIESSPLNDTQRDAVVINQDHNLILAGAGSGKTSVLVAKAGYLINSQAMRAEQILMLAFGNDAAKEMAERLTVSVSPDIRVATFHRLAMQLIEQGTGKKPRVAPHATDDSDRRVFFNDFMVEHLKEPVICDRWQTHLARWPIPGMQQNGNWLAGLEASTIDWLWERINLLAQNQQTKAQWKQAINATQLAAEHQQQAISELNLLWAAISAYHKALKSAELVDFNTMIHQATQLIEKGKVEVPWSIVMVDEYQDISPHRLAMIEAMTTKGACPSLFAVGDDWQAIYRFAGAEVGLTTEFAARYPDGHIGALNTTYRFTNMLGDVANRFIQQNKKQLPKTLNAQRQQRKKAVVLLSQDVLEQELSNLAKQKASKSVSVLLLGRTHKQRPTQLGEWQAKWPQLSLHYMTCHASKGQQADFVFILEVNQHVFPMKSRDLGIMKVLQHEESEVPFPEERRLFYVALTRAKQQVWVCADPQAPSPFVDELIAGKYPLTNKLKKGKR